MRKYFFTQKFIAEAKKTGRVTEGICVDVRDSFMSACLDGESDRKKKTIVAMYEYIVNGKRYFLNVKFRLTRDADKEFHNCQPYKVNVFYDARNPQKACWERKK